MQQSLCKLGIVAFLVLLLSTTSGCNYVSRVVSGMDTPQYIDDYEAFIHRVQVGYADFTPRDWAKADKELYRYSHEWYPAFYPDMDLRQKIEVGQLPIMFYLYKYESMVKHEVKQELRTDAKLLIRSVKEIMDTTANIYRDFDQGIETMLEEFRTNPAQR